ncbi:hypothetical protein [Colwellia asteriadis]
MRFITFYFCALSLFFCQLSNASTPDNMELYWLTNEVNDHETLLRPSSEKLSTANDTIRLLMENLPQYQFKVHLAQGPSINRLLEKLPNSCAPNRIKTPERLEKFIYSLPINLYLDLHLYYKKENTFSKIPLSALNEQQQLLNLSSLFSESHENLLGVDEGRSFGAMLDEQIASLNAHNIIVRGGGNRSRALVKMLFKERINYIIDYPTMIKESLNTLSIEMDLVSLEIANMPSYITGHIACNKSEFGKEVIADINNVLRKLYKTHAFYEAHSHYIDKADIEDFNRAYKEVYQTDIPKKAPQ